MQAVASGVWQLYGFPAHAINVYLLGDVLVDTATRWAGWWLLKQLKGRRLSAVALTHCHPDHQGMAARLCRRFDVPLACHEGDVPIMEGRRPFQPRSPLVRMFGPLLAGPPYPVGRVLHEGDEIGGFRVVHAPGHTPGHVFYFRESDRVVIAGDVLANMHAFTGRVGLQEPPGAFSVDRLQNRQSMRKLLELRPSVACFAHGPPLRELGQLERFVAART